MADHIHGKMDIKDQEKTFDAFITYTTRSVIVIFAVLIFLAIFTI
ncbi:MAG: aa3-type cytochrome c oxidase subunit IV [Pseudomonadota bacterium]